MTDARRGAVLAGMSALLAATFFIPYKAATRGAAVDTVVIAMLGPAAVLNTIAALVRSGGSLRVTRADVLTAAGLGALTVAGNISMTEALSRIDAGVTSALLQTQVLFVTVAAWLFLREKITGRFVLGAFVALGGFVIMRSEGAAIPANAAGTVWALLAALSFGMMHVVTRRFIDQIRPVAVNALRLWFAVGVLLCLPGRAAGLPHLTGRVWQLTIVAALLGPFSARLCIMFAVRHIPASRAAIVALVTPAFAFALEFAILGVVPSLVQVAGATVILLGVMFPVAEMARDDRRP